MSLCLVAFAASAVRRLIEVEFTGTGTYAMKQSTTFPSGMSIDVTFKDGAEHATDFDFDVVRDGITHDVLTVTNVTARTITWYFPNYFFFKTGDTLRFTTTAVEPAIFTLNATYE